MDKETRMDRGLALFQKEKKAISENADGSFSVPSATTEEIAYTVRLIRGKYSCNCPDFMQRHEQFGICKHIHAVKFWIASQTYLKEESPKPKIFSEDSIQCDKCGSIRVIRYGITAHKQTYWCKDCSHKFTPSLIKKSKFTPELVSLTLDLYFSGTSLRKIARIVSDHTGQYLGATTVYDWIQKFVPKVSEYVNSLAPTELSDTWHADEVFQHMKNGVVVKQQKKKVAFLWQVMDRKTRFMLASKLSRFRDANGAVQAFNTALANAHGQKPENILTDAWTAYKIAIPKTIGKVNHVAKCGIVKPHATNNRIERANATVRERTKVQRGWKSMDSQVSEGMRIHYNFVKPHQALEKQTPAQRAGIPIQNSWSELLRLALKQEINDSDQRSRAKDSEANRNC